MPRKSKNTTLPSLFTDPNMPQPGESIEYYYNGWRFGTLKEIDGKRARVASVIAKKRAKWIPLSDIKKLVVKASAVANEMPSAVRTGGLTADV